MRVEATEAPEAPFGDPLPLQIGEHDLSGIADAHPFHLTLAVDEDSDLAADLSRELGELPRELLGHEVVWGQTPLVELLEAVAIAGLEPDDVALDAMNEIGSRSSGYLLLVCDTSRSSLARAER
jgi:hypothetical protein